MRERACITESACEGDAAWLRWDFTASAGGPSAWQLSSSAPVYVLEHLDFWDRPGSFTNVLLLGALMHSLRRRLAAPAALNEAGQLPRRSEPRRQPATRDSILYHVALSLSSDAFG